MKIALAIPEEIKDIASKLQEAGFESYLVGGCVRDVLRETKPKDWDITTNATPEQIMAIFSHTFYENTFGTVGVVNDAASDETLKNVEVTTYRLEAKYSNKRHPDAVTFGTKIEEDLKRRDFTVNAIAYDPSKGQIVDPYGGLQDIKDKVIKAVGEPHDRFSEDALRMLRAVRLSAELGFVIEPKTEEGIAKNADALKLISKERIRDEFIRILMSERPREGLKTAQKLGVLKYINGDLERGIGVEQNQAHKYDVYEHNLRTLQHAADKEWEFDIRLASLFHDISKPETRKWSKEKNDWTFHGHDVVGARVVKKILVDLKFPNKTIEKVEKMVRWHMFFSDPEKITLSAVRRLIVNIGKENIWDLMNLRVCDRIGTGRPKENPYRFRKYKSMVEEALRDPISVGMLKINGGSLMKVLKTEQGPKIGFILHALLQEVLEDPSLNTEEYLENRAKKLNELSEIELKKLGEEGKEKKAAVEESEVKKIRDKYWVE